MAGSLRAIRRPAAALAEVAARALTPCLPVSSIAPSMAVIIAEDLLSALTA
jgi:hypothetical protein